MGRSQRRQASSILKDRVDGSTSTVGEATIADLYRTMSTIRGFEEQVSALYAAGEIPGFVHLSLGQEAVAAGACWPLRPSDVITSTHRGHGHCIAKGTDLAAMFSELMAKDAGTNRGRGGSMHLCDLSRGIFGANGIVGAGLPIAVGAALAAAIRFDSSVVVAFFGDGAVAQGAFHEAVNLASLWRLPLIFLCENNQFAEFSMTSEQQPTDLAARAVGYGVPFLRLDGNDAVEVASAMGDAVERTRHGAGPMMIEALTYRWAGHYEGDPSRYRPVEEVTEWRSEHDPLRLLRDRGIATGTPSSSFDAIDVEVARVLTQALLQARDANEPPPDALHDFVIATRPPLPAEPIAPTGEATYRYMDAIHDAIESALESDPSVFLAGIDVGKGGNVFGLTRGLYDRWPDRVRDTPICETAIMGLAVGTAMAGMRPIVEIMYADFLAVCFDQLFNQAAKMRFMTGGASQMSLVVRTQFGAGRSSGSQHSQSLESLLAHCPGLTVIMPSTPADAYGLLRSAIADPNPVVFIENRHLYGRKGPKPPRDYLVPIGRATVVRRGRDITVVSVSRMVYDCLAAADVLMAEGVDVEVIDLRTIAPLDFDTVLSSIRRTGRLVIAHEAVVDFGIGAEIAARAASEAFWYLDAPVGRVGASATPPPYAPSLERVWLPDVERLVEAIRNTVLA